MSAGSLVRVLAPTSRCSTAPYLGGVAHVPDHVLLKTSIHRNVLGNQLREPGRQHRAVKEHLLVLKRVSGVGDGIAVFMMAAGEDTR